MWSRHVMPTACGRALVMWRMIIDREHVWFQDFLEYDDVYVDQSNRKVPRTYHTLLSHSLLHELGIHMVRNGRDFDSRLSLASEACYSRVMCLTNEQLIANQSGSSQFSCQQTVVMSGYGGIESLSKALRSLRRSLVVAAGLMGEVFLRWSSTLTSILDPGYPKVPMLWTIPCA